MKYIMLVLTALLFSACSMTPFDGTESIIPDETDMTENSAIFVADENLEQYVFETNDTKYISEKGYTLWMTAETNGGEHFENISATVCKESGRKEAGFGIMFCSQKIDDVPFMLTVLINANGMFAVGKVTDGLFSSITGWKSSAYINKGYGIKNRLDVSYDSNTNKFSLAINGYLVTTFAVSENIVFKDSKSGYVVVIANNESFPENSVKVTFEYN